MDFVDAFVDFVGTFRTSISLIALVNVRLTIVQNSTARMIFSALPPQRSRQRAETELLLRKCVERWGSGGIKETPIVGQLCELNPGFSCPESLLSAAAAEVRRRMHLTDSVSLML